MNLKHLIFLFDKFRNSQVLIFYLILATSRKMFCLSIFDNELRVFLIAKGHSPDYNIILLNNWRR